MNTADIHKMIAEAYELEGLLLLADNRGDDTPEYVFTAISEKLSRLQALLADNAEKEEPEPEEEPEEEPEADKPVEEEESESPESEEVPVEMPIIEDITAADDTTADEDEQIVEVVIEDEPEEDLEEEKEVEEEFTEEEETTDDEAPAESEAETKPIDESIRLDEKLQRTRSKDLKQAFSLNDMFRFRRELFGNSGAVMTDALHLVEAMQSYDEAEDYFYGDLGWDRESDDVKEFMETIKKHFL